MGKAMKRLKCIGGRLHGRELDEIEAFEGDYTLRTIHFPTGELEFYAHQDLTDLEALARAVEILVPEQEIVR
jgi:hypothetical protein